MNVQEYQGKPKRKTKAGALATTLNIEQRNKQAKSLTTKQPNSKPKILEIHHKPIKSLNLNLYASNVCLWVFDLCLKNSLISGFP